MRTRTTRANESMRRGVELAGIDSASADTPVCERFHSQQLWSPYNTSWRMFAGPKTGCRPRNPWVQEIKGEDAPSPNPDINAIGKHPPFKKRGHLSPQERKHHMDKNLCLYCGEAGHKAINCTKPPNRCPGGSLHNMETLHEDEKEAIYPTEDTAIGLVSINSLAPLDYIKDSTMTNSF